MKKSNLIIIGSLIIVVGIICVICLYHKPNNSTTSNNTSKTTIEEKDFSGYTESEIDLNKESEVVEITSEGVYTLTGEINGYVKIDTEGDVKLILDNVTIKNSNGPAIYVVNAKNVYIELVGESTLEDGSSYSGYDEDVNACIYSKDDLFITGSGTLNIKANYEDGIVSKDDLTITSGTVNIESKDDAIRGKDSVTIIDGTFTITAGGDGIKSTNDEDTEKGNITIENGTFNIKADNDGIQAENSVTIEGGTFNITTAGGSKSATTYNEWASKTGSEDESTKGIKSGNNIIINGGTFELSTTDDGIHSNGDITINNGKITITSDDDAIHADGMLEINNGTLTLTAHEGLEATYVKINDGTINISASDDGINAGNKSSDYSVTIEINGGNITIKMGSGDTDGIDSNGNLYINGGTINITGNSPFDYDGEAKYNGGTLIVNGQETNTITNQFMGGGQMGQGNMRGNMQPDMQGNMNMKGGRMR